MGTLDAFALTGLPEIARGDDLAALIAAAAPSLGDTDIVVIAHKVVSKAQGRVRRLAEIDPRRRARAGRRARARIRVTSRRSSTRPTSWSAPSAAC